MQVNRINPVDGECALSLAVQVGDVVMVEKLLELSCDVNALNPHNMYTPLHHAALSAHLPIVEALLDSGANVNDKTDTGACVLCACCGTADVRHVRVPRAYVRLAPHPT